MPRPNEKAKIVDGVSERTDASDSQATPGKVPVFTDIVTFSWSFPMSLHPRG